MILSSYEELRTNHNTDIEIEEELNVGTTKHDEI